jgi:hypothetical protein
MEKVGKKGGRKKSSSDAYIIESVVGFCDFVVFPRTNWSILSYVYI